MRIEIVTLSLVLFGSIATLLLNRQMLGYLIEAINKFRGGPPPGHPLPANDSAFLQGRTTEAANKTRRPSKMQPACKVLPVTGNLRTCRGAARPLRVPGQC